MSEAVYAACNPICEELEATSFVLGNGHHMAQAITRYAVAVLRGARWVGRATDATKHAAAYELGLRYRTVIALVEPALEKLHVLCSQQRQPTGSVDSAADREGGK